MENIVLHPIGIVRNAVASSPEQLKQGVQASIEIFPEFVAGLLGVERSTHIMVIGWLHRADRNVLQVHRPRYVEAEVMRGVFACRTPVRPNPLGVTTVRLIGIDGNVLHVDGLDMTDGTPVLDIKPHSPGFDSAFSARSARDLSRLADPDVGAALIGMLREAENFHGERCVGLVLGAKMIYKAMKAFNIAQKDPRLAVRVGRDGCIADAVQALSAATFGNKRLRWSEAEEFVFVFGRRRIRFRPRYLGPESLQDALTKDIAELCEIEEEGQHEISALPVKS